MQGIWIFQILLDKDARNFSWTMHPVYHNLKYYTVIKRLILSDRELVLGSMINCLETNIVSRLILSGTPIQNGVSELWALFDFLMPGYLGTEKQFNHRYARPIINSRDAKCSVKEQVIHTLCWQMKGFLYQGWVIFSVIACSACRALNPPRPNPTL